MSDLAEKEILSAMDSVKSDAGWDESRLESLDSITNERLAALLKIRSTIYISMLSSGTIVRLTQACREWMRRHDAAHDERLRAMIRVRAGLADALLLKVQAQAKLITALKDYLPYVPMDAPANTSQQALWERMHAALLELDKADAALAVATTQECDVHATLKEVAL